MAHLVNRDAPLELRGTSAGVRAGWIARRAKRGGLLNKSPLIRKKVYRKRERLKASK